MLIVCSFRYYRVCYCLLRFITFSVRIQSDINPSAVGRLRLSLIAFDVSVNTLLAVCSSGRRTSLIMIVYSRILRYYWVFYRLLSLCSIGFNMYADVGVGVRVGGHRIRIVSVCHY
jgi:hypothetical protein